MYWFSTCRTLLLLPLSIAFTVLKGCEIVQVLVRPHRVVDVRPGLQLFAMGVQLRLHLPDLIEFFAMRPLGALDVALQLGAARRHDKQRQARAAQAASNTP